MLPILRNTVTGLAGVDPALIEAARGVGMTPRSSLRRVELPLALPVIVAGIRTAAVWTVGMATLSTPVGAPSLGNYIFSGLQTRNLAAVLVGCVAAAVLALCLDGLVRALGAAIASGRRRWAAAVLRWLGLLSLRGVVRRAAAARARRRTRRSHRREDLHRAVRPRRDPRRQIERDDRRRHGGRAIARLDGRVRRAPRRATSTSTSTTRARIWATIMRRERRGRRPRRSCSTRCAQFLREQHGIEVAGALGFENAYALAMRAERPTRARHPRASAISRRMRARLAIGGDYEFFARRGVARASATPTALALPRRSARWIRRCMYQAVASGRGRRDQRLLDRRPHRRVRSRGARGRRGAIPPYDAVVLAGARLAREHPDVVAALRQLAGTIDAARMRAHEPGRRPGWHEPRNGRRGVPDGASGERRSAQSPLSTQRKCNHEDTKSRRGDPASAGLVRLKADPTIEDHGQRRAR